MADANFDVQTETDERERVLRRPLQAPLLRPPPMAQPAEPSQTESAQFRSAEAEPTQSPAYGGQGGVLDSGRAAAQRVVAGPALETAAPDRAPTLAAPAADDLSGALQRQLLRESPPIPGYFATPPGRRAPGQKPAAGDWVGLYGHEMTRQQRLGGERGIDGRAAAEIQRLTAGGLGEAYRTSRQPLPERAQQFGGQLAALGQWPLGGQVSSAVLARLGPADGPLVQGAMQEEQARLQEQALQDEELLAQHAGGANLAGPAMPQNRTNGARQSAPFVRPLVGQTGGFAGTPAAAGGLPMTGAASPATAEPARAPSGGVQVQANARSAGQAPAPSSALNQPGTAKPAPTTPATTTAATKPAPKSARPAPAKVPVRKPATTGGKAAAGKTQATTERSKGAAVPMRVKPKAGAKAAAKPGAQTPAGGTNGSAPSLRAVPMAQLPKGLSLGPVMQLDQTALFDGAQWNAEVAKEAQQAKLKKAGAGRQTRPGGDQRRPASLSAAPATSPAPTGSAPASPAPRRAGTTAGRLPLSKLGRTLPAAKIKQAEAAERKAADAAMSAFVRRNQAKVKALSAAKAAVAPKVQGAAKSAQAKVAGAAKTASAQIAAAATSATGKVQAAGTAARAKIQADFASSSQAVRAATKSAQTTLQADHKAAVAALTTGLTGLNTDTRAEYTAAQTTALGISAEQAGEASKTGEAWAAKYAAEPLAKQSGWEDFTNGEDYPAKKREAKVQAARSVGQGYHDQLKKSGDEYAGKLPEGAAQVETVNQKLHDDSAANLDKLLQQNLQALQAAEQQAIQGLTAARQAQLQALEQQLSQARQGIAQQRASLTGQVQRQASSKQAAIAGAASRGVAALHKSADSAVAGLNKQISGIQAQMRGKGVPDAGALKAKLGQADGQLAGGVAGAKSALTGGAQQTAAGLTQQGASAAAECAATAAQGRQGLTQLGAEAASSAGQLASSAGTTFKGLAKGHEAQTKALTNKAKQGIKSVQDSFKAGADKMVAAVKAQMKQATTALENDLKNGRADEVSKIQAEAEAAADKVEPRWKGWVSFIIDVVIAIAITALVIATAGTAGILMAIVVGVVAGAASGLVGQLAKDALNGQLSDGKTYLMAAVGGAIGGALGAVGGAGSGVLAKTLGARLFAEGAKRTLTTVAIDFVGNNVVGLGTQVAVGLFNEKVFGVKFDIGEVFKPENIAKNAVMTGIGTGAGKYFEANPGVPNRIRSVLGKEPLPVPHVQAPKLDAPEVQAPKPNMPEMQAPKTEAPSAQTPAAPKPGEAAAAPSGRPPTRTPTREAPPATQPPRPAEMPTTPTRGARSPGQEPGVQPRLHEGPATPGGAPEATPARSASEPRPDVSSRFETRSYERGGLRYEETSGQLGVPGEVQVHRDRGAQRRVSRGTGDDAGHRIGDRFGPPGDERNLAQQNRRANQGGGTFHDLENSWAAKLQDGTQIESTVTDVTRPGETRPFMRKVSWTERAPDGTVTQHELTFANTHTPTSRANQGIPDRVSGPQTDNVTHVDFGGRGRPDPSGPGPGGARGRAAPTPEAPGPTAPRSNEAGPNATPEAPQATGEGPQAARFKEDGGSQTSFDAVPPESGKVQARHRGDPFAFGKGPRAGRAQAMVEEAVKVSGISNLTDYVDIVTYEGQSSFFDVDVFGNRVLNVGRNAFGRNKIGQVHEVAHELVHAQQFRRAVLKHGGDADAAAREFFGHGDDSAQYALDEVVAEKLSMRRVERHYGDISAQQKAVSTRYQNFWRSKIDWTEVFNESSNSSGTVSGKPRGGNPRNQTGVSPEGTGISKTQGPDGAGLRNGSREMAGLPEGTRPADPTVRLSEPPAAAPNPAAQSQRGDQGGPQGIHAEGTGLPAAQGTDGRGLRDGPEGVAGLREEARPASPLNPDLNPNSVAALPGQVTGEYDYTTPGPLAPDKAATFVGQRYKSVKLQEDLVLYRVGEEGKPLGQFFDTKAPVSEIQARIDKAVLPEWPGGGKSPVQAVHEIRVPKGTEIYVGEVASQGDFYTGGTRQVVVIEPWKINGLEVLSSKPVNRIEVKPAVPAETVGGIEAVTPTAATPELPAPKAGTVPEAPSIKPAEVTPPHTPQELTQGLPPALRERVPVEVNSELPGNTVRVKYEHENGVIKSVKIEAGPNATPHDIQLHAATVQTMQRFMGLRGRVRAGIDQIKRMVGLDGTPKLGTRAWEANLELQKLDAIIGDRQNQLAASQDPAVRARLDAELAHLEQQVQTHEQALARMDQNPGEGFVAAEGIREPKNADVWNQVKTDSPEQLQTLKNDYDIYMKDGQPFLRQKSQTSTNQKMQFERNTDGTFTVKPASNAPKTLAESGIDPSAPHEVKNAEIWATTESRLAQAVESGALPEGLQQRLQTVLKEDLAGGVQAETPLPIARQRVVERLNQEIGEHLAQAEHPIQDLRRVLDLVQQPGSQGSIAEHLANRLHLDPEYIKTAFRDGQNGLELLERTQVILDNFKAETQHGVEIKSGYEDGNVDVNQAKNYARLIENGQMQVMDYLVMPSSKSNPEVAARNILRNLRDDPTLITLVTEGDINVNFVNDNGQVLRINRDGTLTPVTIKR